MDDFLSAFGPALLFSAEEIVCSLLLAFVLTSANAYVYRHTHEGFNSARSFTHTLVLGGLVTAVLIMAIGNNLARGLGILGTLAIIRFRTQIRDPRDIIFLFASLACGIAAGAKVYSVAIIGNMAFCGAAYYLYLSPFASRRAHDGVLRFTVPAQSPDSDLIRQTMENCCSAFELIVMREAAQGDMLEYSYHFRLVDPSYQTDLLNEMKPYVEDVQVIMNRTTVEL